VAPLIADGIKDLGPELGSGICIAAGTGVRNREMVLAVLSGAMFFGRPRTDVEQYGP